MSKMISIAKKAYLAGLLDGDGSIYVRLKPNSSYKYDFQIAPYVVFFQSSKEVENFKKICALMNCGYLRKRKDGMLEYTIGRRDEITKFLGLIKPYLVLKRKQADLMIKILEQKDKVKNKKDFNELAKLIDGFRELDYSKKRKRHNLTP